MVGSPYHRTRSYSLWVLSRTLLSSRGTCYYSSDFRVFKSEEDLRRFKNSCIDWCLLFNIWINLVYFRGKYSSGNSRDYFCYNFTVNAIWQNRYQNSLFVVGCTHHRFWNLYLDIWCKWNNYHGGIYSSLDGFLIFNFFFFLFDSWPL